MGNRCEERVPLALRAVIWGADVDGNVFVEEAQTLDISTTGARIQGLSRRVEVGTILGVQHGDNRGRFRLVWVGTPGAPREGQIGIRCIGLGQRVNKSVLYVDDQEHERQQRGSLLQSCGYEAETAATGRSAWELCQTRSFDTIIVDYPLLDIDTEAFVRELKRAQSKVKIVIVSAFPRQVPETLLGMVDGFVHKGEAPHKLLCSVEEMIGPGTQVKWPITRCDNRYAVAIPVAVQVIRAGVTSNHTGRMNDLSESGLCASVDGDLAPGELVTVSFNLPTAARAFRIHATVRRRTCNDYGLAFVDVTPEQQLCIRNLCGVLPPLEALQDSGVMYR